MRLKRNVKLQQLNAINHTRNYKYDDTQRTGSEVCVSIQLQGKKWEAKERAGVTYVYFEIEGSR